MQLYVRAGTMIRTTDGRNKVDQTLNGSGAEQSRVEQNKASLRQ